MTQPLAHIQSLTNEELDLQIALLEGWQVDSLSSLGYIQLSRAVSAERKFPIINGREATTAGKGYSPTTNWEVGGKIIDREKIIIKKNSEGLFCIPVFEYQGKVQGILASQSHLRTAMMYYLARQTGVICESD